MGAEAYETLLTPGTRYYDDHIPFFIEYHEKAFENLQKKKSEINSRY